MSATRDIIDGLNSQDPEKVGAALEKLRQMPEADRAGVLRNVDGEALKLLLAALGNDSVMAEQPAQVNLPQVGGARGGKVVGRAAQDMQSAANRALQGALRQPNGVAKAARTYGQYTEGPASLGDVASGKSVLQFGHKGEAVRQLQHLLNMAGAQPPLAEDGLLGPKTEAALKGFQASAGLGDTGVLDAATLEKLQEGKIKIDPEKAKNYKPDYGEWGDGGPGKTGKAPFGSAAGDQEFRDLALKGIQEFNKAHPDKPIPESWADSPALRRVMMKESGGRVGVPNYTFKGAANDPDQWANVHQRLKNGEVWTESTATGLFQLTRPNVQKYYPSGLQGIGNPVEEMIGGLGYIRDRYGSPDRALAFHESHNWY